MKIFHLYIDKKSKFFQTISLILIMSILSYFVIYSKSNYKIVTNIVDAFISSILPSLFPFILFSNILIYSNYFSLISNSSINNIVKHFFKVSKHGASAIIFGFLFGYPNGARYVNELYISNKISFKEAEYLLLFINNGSPAFILSTIGISMFENLKIGILLLISHILASILVGKIYSYKYEQVKEKDENLKNINMYDYSITFEVITKSITKSIFTMCMIFGFMVIFVLMNNYLLKISFLVMGPNKYVSSFSLCIMEITSGIKKLIKLPYDLKSLLAALSFFLGFSSLSIIFQIFSCVYKNKFKLNNIIKGKLLHGLFSAIITYILLSIPNVYQYVNLTKNVNHNIDLHMNFNLLKYHILIYISFIIIYLYIFIHLYIKKKRLKNRFS